MAKMVEIWLEAVNLEVFLVVTGLGLARRFGAGQETLLRRYILGRQAAWHGINLAESKYGFIFFLPPKGIAKNITT